MDNVQLLDLQIDINNIMMRISSIGKALKNGGMPSNKKAMLVLKYRFGLGGCRPLTLKQLGEKLSVTPERVRQLENRGICYVGRCVKEIYCEYLNDE